MIYLESLFSNASCSKMVGLIKECAEGGGKAIGRHDSLRVFNNNETPEISSTFTSLPEFSRINEIHLLGSLITGDEVEGIHRLYVTFGMYAPGSSLGPHEDMTSASDSTISFTAVLYFNDGYDGGELIVYDKKYSPEHFRNRNLIEKTPDPVVVAKIKPATGSVVVISSGTFHEVMPILSGDKYIATMLFHKKRGEDNGPNY